MGLPEGQHEAAPTPTPVGGRSFASPAMVRILLAPAGPDVTPAEFDKWSAAVRNWESVKLTELPKSQTGRPGPATGSAMARTGEVHLSFITSYDPSHSFLAPFSMHRQVLGVLGLGTSHSQTDREALERAPTALRQLHPSAVVHRVFAFDTGAARPQTIDLSSMTNPGEAIEAAGKGESAVSANGSAASSSRPGSSSSSRSSSSSSGAGFGDSGKSGLVVFPAVRKDMKDVRFYLKTLIPDFVSSLLDGVHQIVEGLEGTPLETPRETLDGVVSSTAPSAPSASSSTSSALSAGLGANVSTAASSAASRASALFSSFGSSSSSSSSATSTPNETSTLSSASSMISSSSSSSSTGGDSPLRKSTLPSTSATNSSKRSKTGQSIVSAGPRGQGRIAKVKADYHLLAGDLWSALTTYDACMAHLGKERALAGGQDSVWYASALEGWAVTRVLVRRMGGLVEEKAPSLTLPLGGTKEKTAKEREKERAAGLVDEFAFSKQSWSDVAEACSLALQIYTKCLAPPSFLLEPAKSVTNETPRDYTHPLIHTNACLSYSRLLLAIWASGGWNGETFDQLLYGGVPPALAETTRPTLAVYTQHSTASSVQRSDIASPASLALTHSARALKAPDQVHLLCSLASIFGCIGFARREAYLLRQLQTLVVSLLAKAIIQQRRQTAVASTSLRKTALAAAEERLGSLVSQVAWEGAGEGTDSVLVLALQTCETYGVNVDVLPLSNIPSDHILSRAASVDGRGPSGGSSLSSPLLNRGSRSSWGASASLDSIMSPTASSLSRDTAEPTSLQDEAPFGWAEQQIGLLKETVCVAELLSDNIAMSFFATLLLRDFHWFLSKDEQARIVRGLQLVTRTAKMQEARELEVSYWGPSEPVCGLILEPMRDDQIPRKRPAGELRRGRGSGATAKGEESTIYNSSSLAQKAPAQKKGEGNVIVAEEKVGFLVTLQNPFEIALELTQISLDTFGADFEADVLHNVSVPPSSFHTIRLSGKAKETGTLVVRGVDLTLAGCAPKTFAFTQMDSSNEKLFIARQSEIEDRKTRLKSSGLDARPSIVAAKRHWQTHSSTKPDDKPAPPKRLAASKAARDKFLECQVLPAQPRLTIQSVGVAVSSGASSASITVLEGQATELKVRVRNESSSPSSSADLPVDFLRFTLDDDLSANARDVLADGDLLAQDAHDVEEDLLQRPVLSYDVEPRSGAHRILPGKSKVLTLKLRAKVDCTRLSIGVEYGFVEGEGRGGLETEEARDFFVKSCKVEVGICVLPIVRLGELEILPLLQKEKEEDDNWCLVSFGVQNVHSHPVKVAFHVNDNDDSDDSPSASTSTPPQRREVVQEVSPSSTIRLSIPIRRLGLTKTDLAQAIPNLSSHRQFIVSRIKFTNAQEREARRRFWILRALWKRLGFFLDQGQGKPGWTDVRTGAKGDLGWDGLAAFGEEDEDSRTRTTVLERLTREPMSVQLEVRSQGEVKVEQPTRLVVRVKDRSSTKEEKRVRMRYRVIALGPPTRRFFNDEGGADDSPEGRRISYDEFRNHQDTHHGGGAGQRLGTRDESSRAVGQYWSFLFVTDGSWSGYLDYSPGKGGQEATVELGVLFLASGTFRFAVTVDEVRSPRPDLQSAAEEEELKGATSEIVQVLVSDDED
ncbi:hypothetical protein FA10DRAFT_248239 [Acaromyces ingoldii]|uniref:Trs120-domain-containing protein n=1 Tax=Acaromyces ingoldii TaxID=215250 RepID=A0A316YXJ6_9BASI|nr:hypothetical protein FA10DRAFT_248239 [Acaromyces ingoldii]PWN93852.1 hypothetical protein FA10DRAFT_248239 [Acaromyces ingoldii]